MSETACRRCWFSGRGCPAGFEARRAEGKAEDGCRQRRPYEAGPGCSDRIDLSPKGKSMVNADGVEGRYRVRGAWPALRGVRSAACAVRYIRIPGLVYLTPLSYPIRFRGSISFAGLIRYWNQQLATIGPKQLWSCPEVYPQHPPCGRGEEGARPPPLKHQYQPILLGSQTATSGMAMSSASTNSSIRMKGMAERITCPMGTSKGAIPFIT